MTNEEYYQIIIEALYKIKNNALLRRISLMLCVNESD